MKKAKRNNRLVHRSPKGFGASHPFAERSSTNLGKNPFSDSVDNKEESKEKSKVAVSRAFSGKTIKIEEDRIRKIIREEIRDSLSEGFSWGGKKYYMPWEEEASFDPRESIFADAAVAGTEKAAEEAKWLYDVNKAAAAAAADDISSFFSGVGNFTSNAVVTAYRYWTGKGFTGTLEEFVEEFSDMTGRAVDGYNNWMSEAREAAGTRTPGSPPGSIYLVFEPWAREMIPYAQYNSVVRSVELEADNIFDVITMFYNTPALGIKQTASWWNGETFPEYEGILNWGNVSGTSLSSNQPQYEWLAAKFKQMGITSDDSMFQHLALYAPEEMGKKIRQRQDATDRDSGAEITVDDLLEVSNPAGERVRYRSDFESPFFGERNSARKEISKIKAAMSTMRTDGSGNAIWRVFYGSRGFTAGPDSWLSQYRDAVEIGSRLEGALGSILDLLAEIPIFMGHLGDANQICVFSHWTDDPRWIQMPNQAVMSRPLGALLDSEGKPTKILNEPCMTFKMP